MRALELREVTKSFGGVRAADSVSLTFEGGAVTALIGPNGAGKTTAFNLISGFIRPDRGEIRYRGESLAGLPPWRIAALGVGRVFQDARLFGRMSVLDNVLVSFRHRKGEEGLLSALVPWKVAARETSRLRRAEEILEATSLGGRAGELAETLSFGQQKLLAVARLLAAEADVLLIDEPTAGVSPQRVDDLLDLLRRLASEGRAVAIIEHNMNAVARVADRVYFMSQGRITASGTVGQVLAEPEVRAAYIGI